MRQIYNLKIVINYFGFFALMINGFYKTAVRLFFNGRQSACERRYFINFTSVLNQQIEKKIMKVLNVAEKNDAAKNIAKCISRGGNRWVSINIALF